jgi:hypothetical protein
VNPCTECCPPRTLASTTLNMMVSIDVEAAYSMEEPFQACHAKESTTHKVQQGLLHKRLGGRAYSTIQLATEDNIWSDVEATPEEDDFCTTGKITMARKADRGSKPLENNEQMAPGTYVMVDIVDKPCKAHSIMISTEFEYYLCVTDIASRFFVPNGLKDKSAASVCDALQRWAIRYGLQSVPTHEIGRRLRLLIPKQIS